MLFRTLRCSFCRRDESRVAKLVAGPRLLIPRVYICDRCAYKTIRIMEMTPPADTAAPRASSLWARAVEWINRSRPMRLGSG